MFFTIYKTTNLVNGKYYIGQHRTEDLEDGYLGSGTVIKRALAKYGVENFCKEILFLVSSQEEMDQKEAELVNEETLQDPLCMNITIGGSGGGWWWINENLTEELRETRRQAAKKTHAWMREHLQDPQFRDHWAHTVSEEVRRRHVAGVYRRPTSFTFKGRHHTEETRQKMHEAHAGRHVGEKNSQHGTIWIHLGDQARKIPSDQAIPQGWERGRKPQRPKVQRPRYHQGFKGKTHSEEAKQKMRSVDRTGERNSSSGTCWINKDGENKRVKWKLLVQYQESGWILGRTRV